MLQKPDGTLTDPGPDTISYLLSTHFPTATPIKKTKYNGNKYLTKEDLQSWDCDWITKEKAILAFKGFHNKKSPGTDNLNPLV